jgi:ubiquinone/menaquinone biosynthesis C-methylase UbiE
MTDKLEEKIKDVFNEISDKSWFSNDIEDDNFQLLALKNYFGNIAGKKILDIGCARGRFAKHMVKDGGIVTGIDLSDHLIDDAKKNISEATFFCGSATDLPFPNELFDIVYSIETFEHIPNTEKAVFEACRVLKSGGKIVIIDKNYFGLNPNLLIPTPIDKLYKELTNQWMYKRNFEFREKYFRKISLDQYFHKYCSIRNTVYLPGFRAGPKLIKLSEKYPKLVKFKIWFTNTVYNIFPFISHYIAWRWTK